MYIRPKEEIDWLVWFMCPPLATGLCDQGKSILIGWAWIRHMLLWPEELVQ